jgi:hypothetical protein
MQDIFLEMMVTMYQMTRYHITEEVILRHERVMVTYYEYIYLIGLFHFQAKFLGNTFYGYRHDSK